MDYKRLGEVIKVLEKKGGPRESEKVMGLAYHSGRVKNGDVFFAIKGYETDGHKYAKDAFQRGATLCVVEEDVDPSIPVWKVENSRLALALASCEFFDNPSREMEVIGITATNGKTTTSFMLDSILRMNGINTGIIGTVEVKYNDTVIPSILTTPESYDLQRHLRGMKDGNVETVIMEVSSSAQELYRDGGTDFDIVTFNNLSEEHIEQHGSYERYIEVKSKLIREAKVGASVVLNGDNPLIARLKDETAGEVYMYSFKDSTQDFTIENLDLTTGFGTFDFVINHDISGPKGKIPKGRFPIGLGTVGYSGVMNATVAIIVSLLKGIDVPTIQKGLSEFPGVERRFQRIYDKGFIVMDDHFANVNNIDATLETLKRMKYNRLFIYYAIRGSRGVTLNQDVAVNMTKWLKELNPKGFAATLSRDFVTKKDEVRPEELKAFQEVMGHEEIYVPIYETLKEGMEDMVDQMQEGDILLLAGCQGMDKGAGVLLDILDKKGLDTVELKALVEKRIC